MRPCGGALTSSDQRRAGNVGEGGRGATGPDLGDPQTGRGVHGPRCHDDASRRLPAKPRKEAVSGGEFESGSGHAVPIPAQTMTISRETVAEFPPTPLRNVGRSRGFPFKLSLKGSERGSGPVDPKPSVGGGGMGALRPSSRGAQQDDALRLRLRLDGRGGVGRGGAGGCSARCSARDPGDAMGKKQVVSEPQVLLSCWTSVEPFWLCGAWVAASRWARCVIFFAGLLKCGPSRDWVPFDSVSRIVALSWDHRSFPVVILTAG